MSAPTLRGICAASVFFGLALALLPEGREKRVASLCVTAALVLMLLGLFRSFRWDGYAVSLAEMRSAANAICADAEEGRRALSRRVIEQECEEYIMDKAADLSLAVRSVKVSAGWSREGVWVPERVSITLAEDGPGRARIASLIEAELGISEQVQEWSIEGHT
ncbi:MAG: hypothetical protein IJQ43_06690 [Oscillospiraceae bacterium]|nr:hypothetical protein [Oscillospiraceae bacterium]